jgi:hypothetical protein
MSTLDLRKLGFDAIFVRKAGESYNPMSLDDFLGLPVDERISLIMGKRLRFFDGEREVSVYDAVKSLDEARR